MSYPWLHSAPLDTQSEHLLSLTSVCGKASALLWGAVLVVVLGVPGMPLSSLSDVLYPVKRPCRMQCCGCACTVLFLIARF